MPDDIEFSKIPTIMKRYSLESKFRECFKISQKYTSHTTPLIKDMQSAYMTPNELEAFFMFSCMHEEVDDKDICEHRGSMMDRIRNSIEKELV